LSQPDHAKLAVECLLAMARRLDELRSKWESEGKEPFSIRGGIQSGEVVAGNVGFAGKKMEYTVIGDTVNLASRLEGTAKYYGVNYLVGENTYQLTQTSCRYRELDKIRVVGKLLPVTIYEPQAGSNELSAAQLDRFHSALTLYRARKWQEAKATFDELLKVLPGDKPCKIYVERCAFFVENPPPADWDGVFNRAEK
jgi:adenylate cyclase